MGQLMIIAKYIIDTCSILNQKSGERYKRSLYKTGWEYIDNCIIQGKIVTCSEIAGEIKDKELQKWLYSKQCTILGIDNEIQENVKMIVTENPKMIEFTKSGNSSSSGDAFLIATAISYNLSVITEENKDKQFKIPQICRRYGVQTYSLVDFWEKEGLVF